MKQSSKKKLLILHPTCPEAGKQTKLPADNWYSINICCKNKRIYKWTNIFFKKESMIPVVVNIQNNKKSSRKTKSQLQSRIQKNTKS